VGEFSCGMKRKSGLRGAYLLCSQGIFPHSLFLFSPSLSLSLSLSLSSRDVWPDDHQLSKETEISSLKSIFLGASPLPQGKKKTQNVTFLFSLL